MCIYEVAMINQKERSLFLRGDLSGGATFFKNPLQPIWIYAVFQSQCQLANSTWLAGCNKSKWVEQLTPSKPIGDYGQLFLWFLWEYGLEGSLTQPIELTFSWDLWVTGEILFSVWDIWVRKEKYEKNWTVTPFLSCMFLGSWCLKKLILLISNQSVCGALMWKPTWWTFCVTFCWFCLIGS